MNATRIRYADSSLDDIAAVLVERAPVSADYLAQAPVIAALAAAKYRSHISYGEAARTSALLTGRPKLKAVLCSLGAPVQLRGLHASAIKPRDHRVIAELVKLDPSTLAQIIPNDSQRVWLDACDLWLRNTKGSHGKTGTGATLTWLARNLTADMSRYEQVGSLVDFVTRGDGEINLMWTWQAALAQVEAWHRRLSDRQRIARMIADKKRRADFDKVICKAPLPDQAEGDGYTFTTLRTARALHEEGIAMHHCVASYAGHVARGRVAVVSIKRDGVHIATLEIDAKGRPAQIKTHCNGAPSVEVRSAASIYALTNWRPEAADDDRRVA